MSCDCFLLPRFDSFHVYHALKVVIRVLFNYVINHGALRAVCNVPLLDGLISNAELNRTCMQTGIAWDEGVAQLSRSHGKRSQFLRM